MRSVAASRLCFCAVLLFVVIEGRAQQRPAAADDPRVGLKPGLRDAGEAAWNMKRVASLPKPEGFFDPKTPGVLPFPRNAIRTRRSSTPRRRVPLARRRASQRPSIRWRPTD